MKNDKLDCIGYVDGKLIEKAEKYTAAKKKNTWVKWGTTAACLCLVLAGALSLNGHFGNTDVVTDYPAGKNDLVSDGQPVSDYSKTGVTETGLRIPALELPETTGGDGYAVQYDMIGLVVYKGGIYTQAERYFGAGALKIDALVGEYLGYATGSINEWSAQEEYAKEFASTIAGEVYEVIGYDTDFRVCVRNEFENENGEKELFIEFLDRLNGITLATGADLFESRLHLRDRIDNIQWQSHGDWNYNLGNIQNADLEPELWEDFLDQLDSGTFVNTWDPETSGSSIYDTDKQAHVFLTMEDGTVISLRLIEGGYVGYDPMIWYFVKIPGDTFDAVFTACSGNG